VLAGRQEARIKKNCTGCPTENFGYDGYSRKTAFLRYVVDLPLKTALLVTLNLFQGLITFD